MEEKAKRCMNVYCIMLSELGRLLKVCVCACVRVRARVRALKPLLFEPQTPKRSSSSLLALFFHCSAWWEFNTFSPCALLPGAGEHGRRETRGLTFLSLHRPHKLF